MRLDPRLDAPYNNRGNVKLARKELDAALADYNRALEVNPRSAQAYLNRGLVELLKGDETDAERDFEHCRAVDERLGVSIDERIKNLRRALATTSSEK